MFRVLVLGLLVAMFAAGGSPRAGAQSQSGPPPGVGLPDFSGLDLVNHFARPPSDPTRLEALCAVRRDSIATALDVVKRSIAATDVAIDPAKVARLYVALAQAHLYTGDMAGAITAFERSLSIATANRDADPKIAETERVAIAGLAVAHLRRGEMENCALNHNAEMCIFPLSRAARHTAPSGSRAAIKYLEQYLARDPNSLEARWLLNVAYQTLGLYPAKVPKRFLIPATAFASKENVGRFRDVAPSLGLDAVGNAGGAVVDDFDNDGLLDIVSSGVDPCEPMRMYRNDGRGFADVSARSRLAEQLGGLNMVQADYDNDGYLDLYVMRGGWEFPMRNSLLHNNRDGTFTDVTAAAGLMTTSDRTQSAAWGDFDNDGNVDLYVGHELTPSRLYRNRGDGTFEDVSARAGVDRTAFTKAVVWGDYDGDGLADLYVSNFMSDNFLYHNLGGGRFEEVAARLGVARPTRSFPCWFFDYDNDGRLDLFVASYTFAAGEWVRPYLGLHRHEEQMRLYHNDGKGGFTDVTKSAGLDRGVAAMGANFGDIDNDGYLDFYLGTGTPSYSTLMPNLMFRNHGGEYFVDVTTSSGTGELQKGHGVAFADVDDDGDEDVYANIGGAVLGDKYNKVLFENPGNENHWIAIRLVGVKANRAAIGAKIRVRIDDSAEGLRYREVTSGGSFGASPLEQHIGLGAAKRIASIEVEWPGGKTAQEFRDVPVDTRIVITEGEKEYTTRRAERLRLGPPAGTPPPKHHHPGRR